MGEEKKEEKEAEKKEEKKEEKEAEKKDEKKEEKPGRELGESYAAETDPHLKNQMIFEFNKMIDASGATESMRQRGKMWKNMVANERIRERALREQVNLDKRMQN